MSQSPLATDWPPLLESADVTKKEIVKKISEDINLTQLKTKDIVQRTLDAIIHTLVSEGRIELRNFGVFEVKRRAPRKARNPRTVTITEIRYQIFGVRVVSASGAQSTL